jgi:hypothetical protein
VKQDKKVEDVAATKKTKRGKKIKEEKKEEPVAVVVEPEVT